MNISSHEFCNQQHEIHYIRTIPISAFLGFIFRFLFGAQAMKFLPQSSYKNRFFYVCFYCCRLEILSTSFHGSSPSVKDEAYRMEDEIFYMERNSRKSSSVNNTFLIEVLFKIE